ncbi:ion transporter [uncultured Enterovirga sp.]|uniref:ion transporter n=1 Tax=uncultured Enterovirga sp. TaxID=2026352 RepID=UPI0035CB4FF6
MLARILQDPRTERVILGLILFNAITLGLEAEPWAEAKYGPILDTIDTVVLCIFVAELTARIAVQRLAFFRDPWNVFDFLVIGVALVPATGSLSVLRALRVLRVLRLVTVVPSLKRVVNGLMIALPGMASIMILLLLVFYVFSVMGAKLYGATKPELFGSLGTAAYTLFQVMTFDDWSSGVVKPLMETHPFAWLFFVAFMLLSSFMALNLFIGVVVSALDEETADDVPKLTRDHDTDRRILEELAALRVELAHLRGQPPAGQLTASGAS